MRHARERMAHAIRKEIPIALLSQPCLTHCLQTYGYLSGLDAGLAFAWWSPPPEEPLNYVTLALAVNDAFLAVVASQKPVVLLASSEAPAERMRRAQRIDL